METIVLWALLGVAAVVIGAIWLLSLFVPGDK